MKLRLNLTPRITLVFVLFAAILLGVVGWLSYNSGRSALQASATSELLSSAIEKETAINAWIDERRISLELVASPSLRKKTSILVTTPNTAAGRAAHNDIVAELKAADDPSVIDWSVLHPITGMVVASMRAAEEGSSKKDDAYFQNGKLDFYVKNPYYSETLKKPGMAVAMPLRTNPDNLVGVLVARLNTDRLNAITQQRTGLRHTDDAYLVNLDSRFVTQPRFIEKPVVLKPAIRSLAVQRCLQRNSGVVTAPDYRKVRAIIVYRWMPARQLGLIVKMDQTEALAPANAFGNTILLISILALLLATTLSFGLARTITRPVLALHRGVERFGQGESDVRLSENTHDEVGLLAREFNAMAESISAKETQLHQSEERLRLLVESVRDYAIIMLDPQGHVASWSSGAERVKGYSAGEILGQHFSRFYLPDDVAAGKPEIALETARREGHYEEEHWRVRKDGKPFWANVILSAVRDEAGELRGFSKVTHDVTERRKAEEEIRRLNEELEQRVVERTAQLEVAKQEVEQAAQANRNL
ncbi:MAG TPA: PAS domain S-box protein, partial [Abditibacteriaceae bacterium]